MHKLTDCLTYWCLCQLWRTWDCCDWMLLHQKSSCSGHGVRYVCPHI